MDGYGYIFLSQELWINTAPICKGQLCMGSLAGGTNVPFCYLCFYQMIPILLSYDIWHDITVWTALFERIRGRWLMGRITNVDTRPKVSTDRKQGMPTHIMGHLIKAADSDSAYKLASGLLWSGSDSTWYYWECLRSPCGVETRLASRSRCWRAWSTATHLVSPK